MTDFQLDPRRAINVGGEAATWDVVATAMRLGWIGPKDVLDLAYQGKVSDVLDDQLVALELALDDGEVEARSVVLGFGQPGGASAEAHLHAGLLAQILDAPLSRRQKLEEVASLWTDMGCPNDWKHLVYFNPMSDARRSRFDALPESQQRGFAEDELLADARTYVSLVLPKWRSTL